MKKIMSVLFFGALFTVVIGMTSCAKEKDCIQTDAAENCVCTYEYNPVCGCDGETYGNPCVAECSGILTYTEGVCN